VKHGNKLCKEGSGRELTEGKSAGVGERIVKENCGDVGFVVHGVICGIMVYAHEI